MMQRRRFPGLAPYLLVVFFNAFVDLGHKIIIQNTIFKIYHGPQQIFLTAVVNALILLPFIVCFTPAGYCSDKYPKHLVMRISAAAVVLLTLLITLFYHLGWFWSAFAMTFALALQSAFYSPAKYGYIKELVGKENLSWANGRVQAVTIIAILLGLLFFSILFEALLDDISHGSKSILLQQIAPVGWGLVLFASVEMALCFLIVRTRNTRKQLRYPWRRYLRGQCLVENLRGILGNRMILLPIICLAVFWSISQVMLATFPAHAKETMGILNTVIIQGAMAWAGIGIIAGAMLASRLSGRHIEAGLIPVGMLGVALCLLLLPGLPSIGLQAVNFLLWGLFGGLLIVPLNALIQFHAGEEELGKVLAGNNLLQNVAMFSFLAGAVAAALIGMSAAGIFALLLAAALGGAACVICGLPQTLLRPWLTWTLRRYHRLQVLGLERLPERGGVLLLGEQEHALTWIMVQIASPRPVRFVLHGENSGPLPWRWLMKRLRVLPASDTPGRAPDAAPGAAPDATPDAIPDAAPGAAPSAALDATSDAAPDATPGAALGTTLSAALQQGQVVCLLLAGRADKAAYRDLEALAQGGRGVILPFCTLGLGGGGGGGRAAAQAEQAERAGRARRAEQAERAEQAGRGLDRGDVAVAFGAPMPLETPVRQLRKGLSGLLFDAWQQHSRGLPDIGSACIAAACRKRHRITAIDENAGVLRAGELLKAAIRFAGIVRRQSAGQNAGLLLEGRAALGGTLGVLLAGRTAVPLARSSAPEALGTAIAAARLDAVYSTRQILRQLDPQQRAALEQSRVLCLEDLDAPAGARLLGLAAAWRLPAGMVQRLCRRKTAEHGAAAILFAPDRDPGRGVVLSHRNIMSNVQQIAAALDLDARDTIASSLLPADHALAFTLTTLLPIIEGVAVLCQTQPPTALQTARAIARQGATVLCTSSALAADYCRDRRIPPLLPGSLRLVLAGSGALADDVHIAFRSRLGLALCQCHGCAETTALVTSNVPDRPDRPDRRRLRPRTGNRPGTVGRPLPGTLCRIVDPDTLRPLAAGREGLVLLSGPQIMQGYLDGAKDSGAKDRGAKDSGAKDSGAQRLILEGRAWYRSGARGRLDGDGFLSVTARRA